MTVSSAVSTVSPGPNAIEHTASCAPGVAARRIFCSTNITVALDMFPKSRSVSRAGTSCAGSSASLASTLSRMLRPPGWIAQCGISRKGRSASAGSWASSGSSAPVMCSSMMCGTYVPSTISKPLSPMFQAIASSPTGVSTVSKWSSRSSGVLAERSLPVTTAAAAPSAKREEPTMVSGSFEVRTCSVHSSTEATITTASGSARQMVCACRSAGRAA